MTNRLGLYLILVLMMNLAGIERAVVGECANFRPAGEKFSDVVPKLDESGSFKGITAYGSASFLMPKTSLIDAARNKAELKAKKALSNFFSEDITASTTVSTLIEQLDGTTQDNLTQSAVIELTQFIDTIQSNTAVALDGLLKLDECIDRRNNLIFLSIGWTANTFLDGVTTEQGGSSSDEGSTTPNLQEFESDVVSSTGGSPKCLKNINLTEVLTFGEGSTRRSAIENALRAAVERVYGAVFEASLTSMDNLLSVEEVDSEGRSNANALMKNQQILSAKSSSGGVIDSYSVLRIQSSDAGFQVKLKVIVPKYCRSEVRSNKKKILVAVPRLLPGEYWTLPKNEIAEFIQREVSSLLTESNALIVVNRTDMDLIDKELDLIANGGFATTEFAKTQAKIGADYVVVTEFSELGLTSKDVVIGVNENVRLYIVTANAWIKVIDLASTETVLSMRIPFSLEAWSDNEATDGFTLAMAHNLASLVGERFGGGFTAQGSMAMQQISQKVENYKPARERLKRRLQSTQDSVADDW